MQLKARHRAYDTLFACFGKKYISDLEKKIGLMGEGVTLYWSIFAN